MESPSQRKQYERGGIGKWFRDFRDDRILSLLGEDCRCVADLGCGEGITLEKLARKFPGKRCLGIDLSRRNVRTCRSYQLPAVCGDLHRISLKTESTDCCLLLDVIEHIDQPEAVLREVSRILRPGGALILVFPNDRMFFLARLLFLKLKEAFYDAGHVAEWNPKKMRRFLEENGFRVDHGTSLPFFFWPVSLYHLMRARKTPAGRERD